MNDSRPKYSRVLAVLMVLILSGVAVYLMALVFSYASTGADKSDIYHADPIYFEATQPFVKWLPDGDNIEGAINPYMREDIAKAYHQAIRARNLSHGQDADIALKEHFSQPLLSKIRRQLDTSHLVSFEQTNLTHTLRLNFLSLDKTVVSFEDIQSKVKRRIENQYEDSYEAYAVNMTLVDGRWRIDALERIKAQESVTTVLVPEDVGKFGGMSGINYYPSGTPWTEFWKSYDKKVIEQDLKLIRDLGFVTIRIFIPFEIFGGAEIDRDMLEKLDHFIESVYDNSCYVVPTLFDFPLGYQLDNYSRYDRHLRTILERYDNQEAVLYWDLKNEPDLDFLHAGEEETMEWLDFIIERSRSYTSKPLSIGWSKAQYAHLFCDKLDITSFHYYLEADQLESTLSSVNNYCANPIIVSEYGRSTSSGIWPGSVSEDEQSMYIRKVNHILDTTNVGSIIWCLYDYESVPTEVFGWKPWATAKQKGFGLVRTDGTYKKILE